MKHRASILKRLNGLNWASLSDWQKLLALRSYRLCLEQTDRLANDRRDESDDRDDRGAIGDDVVAETSAHLRAAFPDESFAVNERLTLLLVQLNVADIVRPTISLLKQTRDQQQQLHYLFVLRNMRRGWNRELRMAYFHALQRTSEFTGGEGMPTFLNRINEEALQALDSEDRAAMSDLLMEPSREAIGSPPAETRPFVREWKIDDLADALPAVSRDRDLERGRRLFSAALCGNCHRVSGFGSAIGPDLTSVGARFGRRDLLESILLPSKVVAEEYRNDIVTTSTGRVVTGRIVLAGDFRSELLRISTDPLSPDAIIEIPKREILTRSKSPTSRMPTGLLDTLNKEEILDLLAFLESGGDGKQPQ